jgi:hypothetical protein
MGKNSRVAAKWCDISSTIFGLLPTKSRGHSEDYINERLTECGEAWLLAGSNSACHRNRIADERSVWRFHGA